VLIDARQPRVLLWSRPDDAAPWSDQDIEEPEAAIDLTAIGVSLPLATLYDGVIFEE